MSTLTQPQTAARQTGLLPYVYWNGDFRLREEASLSLSSHTVQYGTQVFTGMRGWLHGDQLRLFRLRDHYDRLNHACSIFGWDMPLDFVSFSQLLEELVCLNAPEGDVYFRPFVYTNDDRLGPQFMNMKFELGCYMLPLGHYLPKGDGLKLMTSSWRKFSDACLPTKAKAGGTYLNASLARTEALRQGCDEALVLDEKGCVVEGSAENVAIVYQDTLLTPPLSSSLLDGLTMRSALTFLEDAGMPCRRAELDRSMVYSADELLLTGTAATVAHAHSLDGRRIGTGKAGAYCQFLSQAFADCLQLKHPRHHEWVTTFKTQRSSS